MPHHTIDSMNWRPKDDAVIPRWVTIKNCACRPRVQQVKMSYGSEGQLQLVLLAFIFNKMSWNIIDSY